MERWREGMLCAPSVCSCVSLVSVCVCSCPRRQLSSPQGPSGWSPARPPDERCMTRGRSSRWAQHHQESQGRQSGRGPLEALALRHVPPDRTLASLARLQGEGGYIKTESQL